MGAFTRTELPHGGGSPPRDDPTVAHQLVSVEGVPARLGVAARAEPVEEERDEKDGKLPILSHPFNRRYLLASKL